MSKKVIMGGNQRARVSNILIYCEEIFAELEELRRQIAILTDALPVPTPPPAPRNIDGLQRGPDGRVIPLVSESLQATAERQAAKIEAKAQNNPDMTADDLPPTMFKDPTGIVRWREGGLVVHLTGEEG